MSERKTTARQLDWVYLPTLNYVLNLSRADTVWFRLDGTCRVYFFGGSSVFKNPADVAAIRVYLLREEEGTSDVD